MGIITDLEGMAIVPATMVAFEGMGTTVDEATGDIKTMKHASTTSLHGRVSAV